MGSPVNTTEVEVFIKESDEGLLLESLESANDCQSHARKTVVLDLSRATEDIITNVTCAAIDLQAIVCLNLSRANIQYVPDAFASLRLKQLNLSHNRLENVPDCLKNGLRCLENLDLSHNELKSFEIVPQCLIKLRVLRINNNKLTNIPQWVLEVNCFNLEELYYGFNEISSLNSSRFHKASSYRLKKVEMQNCLLRSDDIKFFKNICTLTSLDISNKGEKTKNCFVSSDSFSQFFIDPLWHDRLKELRLNALQLSFIPDEIGKLTLLEELYLSKNDLLWLPDTLTSLERLRVLDISHNQIISLPGNLKKLDSLLASNNSISNIPDGISKNLRVLDLYNNYLDTDCDIIINNINEVDLEQNFFDTSHLNDSGYELKKKALRLGVDENRLNGPKEQLYDKSDSCDDASTDSELESGNQGGVEGEFEDEQQESWSPIRELCENGCTSSDNEWTGNEIVRAGRKKMQRILGICPEWMLEDD